MGSFCKRLVFLSVLFLACTSWRAEILAQSGSLRVTWTDTSDNEDGFKIQRLVAGLVDATMTLGPNVNSYTDYGLVNGVVYCYRVVAFNTAGDSNPSNQPCAVAQAIAAAPAIAVAPATVSVNPASANVGGTVTVTWSRIPAPTTTDWIGVYVPGATDTSFINWIYVSCSTTPGSAQASGSCSYALPPTLSLGNYELRLFANDGFTRLATSSFTVNTGANIPPALTVTPTTVKPGSTLTASWSGINAPTAKDWIGLYAPGAADTKFINWVYVSCSQTAGAARASGSCSYVLPATLASGNYELRLLSNDVFTRLATSSSLTVSTSSTTTPIVLANTTTTANGSSIGLLPQAPRVWSDYSLKATLRSTNSNSIGVMFRYQDDKNYYRFVWNRNSKFRRVEKVQNGTITILANDTVPYTSGQTYQLETVVQGPALKILIDGSQIFSVTDSSFADGTVALYSSGNPGSVFDDVVVKDLATGVILLSEDFNDGNFAGWTVVDQSTRLASSWSAANGNLTQSTNINGTFAVYTVRNWTDYRLSLMMQSLDRDSLGVMFRYQDSNNHYRFLMNKRNSFRRLEKCQNGICSTLAEDAKAYVTGRTYQLEIAAKGATLEVNIDGALIFSVADSTFSRGTIGLVSNFNQGSIFGHILLEDLATGAVLLQDDFTNGTLLGWTVVDDSGATKRPSIWSAQSGALVQSTNIGSNSNGALGTYALY